MTDFTWNLLPARPDGYIIAALIFSTLGYYICMIYVLTSVRSNYTSVDRMRYAEEQNDKITSKSGISTIFHLDLAPLTFDLIFKT